MAEDNMASVKQELDVKQEIIQLDCKFKPNESFESKQKGLSCEDKVKEQNRIRQFAFKVREKMPKDYKSYCLVAAHLVRNAHRYYKEEWKEEALKEEHIQVKLNASKVCDPETELDSNVINQEVNKLLREIRTLKRQNRIIEQQERVLKLKKYGSYRDLKSITEFL